MLCFWTDWEVVTVPLLTSLGISTTASFSASDIRANPEQYSETYEHCQMAALDTANDLSACWGVL